MATKDRIEEAMIRLTTFFSSGLSFFARKPLLCIFLTALLFRILCMLALESWEFPDNWQYGYEIGKLAKSLVAGEGFAFYGTPTAKFPPVYPLLVGGVFALFGVYSNAAAITILLFQSACAAVTSVFLVVLGNRFFGWRVGILAGLVWAFYPSTIFHSIERIWYSELSIMLVLALAIIASSQTRASISWRVVWFGGLSGFLLITDSTMMLYLVLLFIWMLYHRGLSFTKWLRLLVIWGVSIAVVISPWAIRNWMVLDTPAILKSNFGLELYYGNNPYSTGGGIDKEREQAMEELDAQWRNSDKDGVYFRKVSEKAYYDHLKEKALDWIRMHPVQFLELSAKRFWYFWGKFPSTGPGIWRSYSTIQLSWYVPTALLALFGFWYGIRQNWNFLFPVWSFLLVYPLPFYVTHVQLYRYRYPVEPFLVLLAAIPLAMLVWRFIEWVDESAPGPRQEE